MNRPELAGGPVAEEGERDVQVLARDDADARSLEAALPGLDRVEHASREPQGEKEAKPLTLAIDVHRRTFSRRSLYRRQAIEGSPKRRSFATIVRQATGAGISPTSWCASRSIICSRRAGRR